MLEKLMNSPIAWTILAILAVVSFIYAIVCQHKNKEKKEFSYCLKFNNLIQKKKSDFDKLLITYNGQMVEDLCVSRFTVWNSGNRTLNSTDIVDSKELTISVADNCKILDTDLIYCSEETNKFSLKVVDESTVKLFFEYVDVNDGLVVQIIHTGSDDDIRIDCKIKGGNQIKNIVNETFPKAIRKVMNNEVFEKMTIFSIGVIIVLFFLMSAIFVVSNFNEDLQRFLFFSAITTDEIKGMTKYTAITTAITFFVSSMSITVMYIPLVKKYFGMGIPKKLKKFSDLKN